MGPDGLLHQGCAGRCVQGGNWQVAIVGPAVDGVVASAVGPGPAHKVHDRDSPRLPRFDNQAREARRQRL